MSIALATIGNDPITGDPRFAFGNAQMTGGLDFNTATGETGDFAITLTNGQTYTILLDEGLRVGGHRRCRLLPVLRRRVEGR